MSDIVQILVRQSNESKPEWVAADWNFCTKYARGEYTFFADKSNVIPSEYFEDIMAFVSEIDRLRKPARGIMSWGLREELDKSDKEIWEDARTIFNANHNREMHHNELIEKLIQLFPDRYSRMSVENLPRRFREIRASGWFAQIEKACYHLQPETYAEHLRKENAIQI